MTDDMQEAGTYNAVQVPQYAVLRQLLDPEAAARTASLSRGRQLKTCLPRGASCRMRLALRKHSAIEMALTLHRYLLAKYTPLPRLQRTYPQTRGLRAAVQQGRLGTH